MKGLLVIVGVLCSSLDIPAQAHPGLDPMHTTQPICDAEVNDGIEYSAPLGTPVQAPANGKVMRVWNDEQYECGLTILIKELDGSVSGFAYLSSASVKVGDQVTQGQMIALSGHSGNATRPTLHYTLFSPEGVKVDPRKVEKAPLHLTKLMDAAALRKAIDSVEASDESPSVKQKAMADLMELFERDRRIAEAEYKDNLNQATDIWYANNGNYKKIPQQVWDRLREVDRYQFKHALPGKEVLSTTRTEQHP